jgi:hypothetical protein
VGDQLVARPLPTHRITQTHMHASSAIRTHDPSDREGKDGSYIRPRGHCDRSAIKLLKLNIFKLLPSIINRDGGYNLQLSRR